MDLQSLLNLAIIPLIVVFGVFAVRARRRHRIVLGFGLRDGAWREFALGLLISLLVMGAIFLLLLAVGAIRVESLRVEAGPLVAVLIYLLLLGVIEEMGFRGLLLPGIAVVTRSRWLAVVITAAVVAVPYAFATGASPISVVSGFLAGIMYGVAYLRTARVWLPAAMRVGWNFFQGPILGFPVSGSILVPVALVEQTPVDAGWLTGGEYGPEASAIGIGARLVVILLLLTVVTGRRGPWRIAPADGRLAAAAEGRAP